MIKRVKESPIIYQEKSVTGRMLSESKKLEYVHITLEANSNMEPHTLDLDADFFVISGEGSIGINGNKHNIREGDFLRIKRGSKRALFTNKYQEMKLLVIKSLV